MFRGINSATLDTKGRMALPARNREAMLLASDGKVVLTIDMRETCLLLYPSRSGEIVQRKLEALSNINPQARLLQRLLIGHATDLELDASGRLLLPAMLRDYADLDKKLGAGWPRQQDRNLVRTALARGYAGLGLQGAQALNEDSDHFTGLSV